MTTLRRVLLVLVALLVSACGGEEAAPAGPTEGVPGAGPSPTQGVGRATLQGTLGGDATLEGGCAWVDADGERYEVLWPEGYEIAFEPLRLLGPDGEIVAEQGDEVTVTGAPAEAMASICQVGTLFQADAVSGQAGGSG